MPIRQCANQAVAEVALSDILSSSAMGNPFRDACSEYDRLFRQAAIVHDFKSGQERAGSE
ncbi:hypothetical protein Pla175_07820 [Pirellulimonas nuda]|uniref:Uncharacterized protein n=1 Tax=Pirellulimonas nuda TaxID=2528009 RepID=A0A518D7G7_9BACT|nr:hypothetical protein Pla175_07820 [Pirellulimonas nuda]